jgi:hypothetical protein
MINGIYFDDFGVAFLANLWCHVGKPIINLPFTVDFGVSLLLGLPHYTYPLVIKRGWENHRGRFASHVIGGSFWSIGQ